MCQALAFKTFHGEILKHEEITMNRKLRFDAIIFLFSLVVCVTGSHGDENDLESKLGNRSEKTGLFSNLKSEFVRVWRDVRTPQCWRSNPEDPKGQLLEGVDCPRRLKIMDKNNPIRRCVGTLKQKHRARDGDLTFDVLPKKECVFLINQSNVRNKKGRLHCEIVPDDRFKFEDIYNRMEPGSDVEVEGVWVEDTGHENWRELHPVTGVRVLQSLVGS
jgi:hypothetical protein